MRKTVRIAFICVMAVFEIVGFFTEAATWEQPGGGFGWNVGTDGVTVINVEPESPAFHAGLVAGDVIVYETLPVLGRLNGLLNEGVRVDADLSFDVRRNGTIHHVRMRAEEYPALTDLTNLTYALGGLALGIVGLLLLLLRPSRMTWAAALIAPPILVPGVLFFWVQQAPDGASACFEAAMSVLYGLQIWGLITFASRFPNDKPRGVSAWIDRLALPFGLVSTAIYLYVTLGIYLLRKPPPHWTLFAYDYGTTAFGAVCAIVALIATYVTAKGADRSRLLPVIVSIVLLIVAQAMQQFIEQITGNAAIYIALGFFFSFSALMTAIAVAYGVIRHRVIDVDFIISRTLVYTILTVIVVAIFALIEYLIGKVLESGRWAEILTVAAAVGVGISMNYLHGWLDGLLDVLFFRRRHEAELRLAKTAHTMPHAGAFELVDEMLVEEPREALDLASAAVFRRTSHGFARMAAAGWDGAHASILDHDDHLVLRLRAELQPVAVASVRWPRTDLPAGDAQPIYAVPVVIGHEVEAITLYGAHAGGEDLDPDERKMLRGLAGGAALAYDHLAERQLRADVDRLERENATLREIENKLTALLESSIGRKAEP